MRSAWRKELENAGLFEKTLLVMVLLAGILFYWGTTSNWVVMASNDWRMPVYDEGEGVHVSVDENTKLVWLADRFLVTWPLVDEKSLSPPLRHFYRVWDESRGEPLPPGLYSKSIGDLMRYAGRALYLIALPLFICFIPYRALKNHRTRGNWRGK